MARMRMKTAIAGGALILLAISTVALSILALQRNKGVPENTPSYTYTPDLQVAKPDRAGSDKGAEVETDPDPAIPVEETEPQREIVELSAATRFLSLGPDGRMLRGEHGTCPDSPGWSEVSFNGGIDWQATNA